MMKFCYKALLTLSIIDASLALHFDHPYHSEDEHAVSDYKFEYKVSDPYTGDDKTHHEERMGDIVSGYYTLREADGTTRYVSYTADKLNGFNAKVTTLGSPNQEHAFPPPSIKLSGLSHYFH